MTMVSLLELFRPKPRDIAPLMELQERAEFKRSATLLRPNGREAYVFSQYAVLYGGMLGIAGGWNPAGTEPPADWRSIAVPSFSRTGFREEVPSHWSGTYTGASHALVTAKDAAAWARGLGRSLERWAAGELGGVQL